VPALSALHAAGHRIAAVYTQPDRPAGRGLKLNSSPVKQRALELGLPVEQPATLKGATAVATLAGYAPELMVVVAYGLILPRDVLAVPRRGCLNIHASLLPRWRGAAPIHRALLAGDPASGVTIMQMDEGLDTGPLLLAREWPIPPRCTGGQLHDALATLGAEAVVEAIEAWSAGRIAPRPQPAEGACYARKIDKAEARIDWTLPADAIDRQVRAFNPWPGAETRWRGQGLKIWAATPLGASRVPEPEPVTLAPGWVSGRGRILVATGAGLLQVERLQLAGRRATSAAEFLNAHPLAGECFE
jgi:methionyl-tRNA formyltransferase